MTVATTRTTTNAGLEPAVEVPDLSKIGIDEVVWLSETGQWHDHKVSRISLKKGEIFILSDDSEADFPISIEVWT